jgi:hypothetical protein
MVQPRLIGSNRAPFSSLPPPLASFGSLIVSEFPPPCAELCDKRLTLRWRGRRDGLHARDFDGRCDGDTNTLTLIEETEGKNFGGVKPVVWELGANRRLIRV